MKSQTFEESLQKIEGIVERLEEGDLPLEDSLKAFEEGMKLVKMCESRLKEAQKKIEVLVRDGKGGKNVEPFESEE